MRPEVCNGKSSIPREVQAYGGKACQRARHHSGSVLLQEGVVEAIVIPSIHAPAPDRAQASMLDARWRTRSAYVLKESFGRLYHRSRAHVLVSTMGTRRSAMKQCSLRIYCLQQWYNLHDPGVEVALRSRCGDSLAGAPTRTSFKRNVEPDLSTAARKPSTDRAAAPVNAHPRGRKYLGCALFDLERREGARSPDAPDQKGQAVGLRLVGAHRGRY